MATVGRLKQGDLLIAGEVNERLPAITNGLVAHFPFDDTLNPSRNSPLGIKVLYQSASNAIDGHIFGGWLKAQGAILTQSTDLSIVTLATAKQYDLILMDFHVWGVSSTLISKAKEFVDGGISVVAVGNDTRTNTFVKTYSTTPVAAHDILIDTDAPISAAGQILPGAGSTDVAGGITELQNGARRLYSRTDGNLTTGYCYESSNGAVLYFDQEGLSLSLPFQALVMWAINRSSSLLSSTNTTLTPDGVAVEEGTTNLVPNPHIFSSGWSAYSNGNDGAFRTEFGVEGMNLVNRRSWCGASRGITLPAAGTYTLSVWVKPISRTNTNIGINLYTSGGGLSDTSVGASWAEDKIGKWQRLTMTRTYTTTGITLYLICFGGSNAAGFEISAQYTMPQIEAKTFPTSFVNGSRNSGVLSLSNTVPATGDYTVSFKCKLNTSIGNVQSYNSIMSMGNYYSNNSWTIMDTDGVKVGGALGFIRKGNAAEWAWATTSLTPPSDLGKEMTITVTKDATNYKCYYNGVLKGTLAHVSANMQDTLWIGSRENGGVMDSTEFKELSIYNRSLSNEEVVKLHGRTFSMQKDGSLVSKVEESPVKTLGTYLPLGLNAEDTTRVINPVTEANTVYENGAVWVGKATTNMWTGTTYAWQSGVGVVTRNSTDVSSPMGPSFEVVKMESTNGANFQSILWTAPGLQTPGHTYTHSAYVMLTKGTYVRIGQHWNPWVDSAPIYIPKNEWVRISFTTTTDHATNVTVAMQYHTDGIVYVTAPQYEYSAFMTPFVMGTRPYSRLTYNTADVIPNVKDFSFLMWVKYQDLSTWQLSGDWSTFYFGPYGSSYIRFSWMENSANTGSVNTQRTVNTSGFTVPKDKWIMIGCSVKENGWIDIYANGKRYANFTSSFFLTTATNFFAFNSLDEGSASYPLNAHIRDAMFIPRAISEVEVEEVYRAQVRSYKGSTIIQGQLKEGEVL